MTIFKVIDSKMTEAIHTFSDSVRMPISPTTPKKKNAHSLLLFLQILMLPFTKPRTKSISKDRYIQNLKKGMGRIMNIGFLSH